MEEGHQRDDSYTNTNGPRRSRFRVDIVEESGPMTVSFDTEHSDQPSPGIDITVNDRKASQWSQHYKSYGNVQTMERPPNIYNYRNDNSLCGTGPPRATLAELRASKLREDVIDEEEFNLYIDGVLTDLSAPKAKLEQFPRPNSSQPAKFGWIQGVLIRCVLNIVGVMLYLRLSWVTGQAGIGLASTIILLSSLVTSITALSMCAICTNGEVKAGGAYFMISRSLGAEFGGSIGVIFSLANVLGGAMHCVGFAEALRDLLSASGVCIVDCRLMDTRIIGWSTAALLMTIVFIGISFEAKAQLAFLVVLIISLINYWIGTIIPPSDTDRAKGITWYSWDTMVDNFMPHFRGESFFSLLGIYFPSATGIMAGANISGDLKDPSAAIPKGTLVAILSTTLLYLCVVWTTGSTSVRYASGSMIDYRNGNLSSCAGPPDGNGRGCTYGLMNYYHLMELDSGTEYLVTAGVFAATLSSALASLISAPKIVQALGRDRIYPFLHHLSKGYGKGDAPYRAYLLTIILVLAAISLGDLNEIAPFVSNFFLASYCLVNYACFAASFSESPGFRPSFRYYNMWISLLGAILCVAMMFVIEWIAAVVTMAFVFLLYVFVWYRKPEVNWGSSSQAAVYKAALQKVQKLQTVEEHVKNYRPQILVLCGNPVARPSLVDFAANITKDISLLVCGHVIQTSPCGRLLQSVRILNKQVTRWLKRRKVKAFYCPMVSTDLLSGVQSLTQLCGLSQLKPNILLMGFKNDWTVEGASEHVIEYFRVISCAFESHMGVGILRVPGGLDFSDPMKELHMNDASALTLPEPSHSAPSLDAYYTEEVMFDSSGYANRSYDVSRRGSTDILESMDAQATPVSMTPRPTKWVGECNDKSTANDGYLGVSLPECRQSLASIAQLSMDTKAAQILAKQRKTENGASRSGTEWTDQQNKVLYRINQFRLHEKRAVIDVWWLFDDGGLTLFIPHMLTLPKSYLEGAKLRVFTVASRKSAIEQEQRSMITLLNKFRIDYEDVFLIPDITRKPKRETLNEFDQLIRPFMTQSDSSCGCGITESELAVMQHKTNRQLRTRELLLEHSRDSSLVVLTLPVPREGATSPYLYMAWLEMLTRDVPPILLLRGNQQSVLTFYS